MRKSAAEQEPVKPPVPAQTLETPQNATNKSKNMLNNTDAMEGLLLDKSGNQKKKPSAKTSKA